MGPLIVLICPCFRKNIIVTYKIVSCLLFSSEKCNCVCVGGWWCGGVFGGGLVGVWVCMCVCFQNDVHLKKGAFLTYFSHFLVTRERQRIPSA